MSGADCNKSHENHERHAEGSYAVGAHYAMARRPREHQHIKDRHEFLRPQKPGYSEGEGRLYEQACEQIIHGSLRDQPFH